MLTQPTLPIKVAQRVGVIVQLVGVIGALLGTGGRSLNKSIPTYFFLYGYQNGIRHESQNRSRDIGQGIIYLSDFNDQTLDY